MKRTVVFVETSGLIITHMLAQSFAIYYTNTILSSIPRILSQHIENTFFAKHGATRAGGGYSPVNVCSCALFFKARHFFLNFTGRPFNFHSLNNTVKPQSDVLTILTLSYN